MYMLEYKQMEWKRKGTTNKMKRAQVDVRNKKKREPYNDDRYYTFIYSGKRKQTKRTMEWVVLLMKNKYNIEIKDII